MRANKDTKFEEIKEIVDSHSDNTIDGDPIPEDIINHCFQPDSIQRIITRLEEITEGRKEGFDKDLATKWLNIIKKMSPVSCAIVVEQIKRGQTMELDKVFEMEYGISQGFMEFGEFYEGVRALLIDRDNKPNWKHQAISEVTQDDINFFFDRPEKLDLNLEKLYHHGLKF